MKRLISDRRGIKTTMEIDGGITTISKSQEIGGHLDFNKAKANEMGKRIYSDAYNHVASIPAILQVKWLQEEGLDIYNHDHAERLKRKLNSSEYRHLRTSELVL